VDPRPVAKNSPDSRHVEAREEAQRLEDHLWGDSGTRNQYKNGGPLPVEEAETATLQEGS
jgi:hypothetical protein